MLNTLDSYRYKYPKKISYTFIGNKGAKTRIDKICISEALKHKIRDLKHIPYQYSDHKIIYVSLKLQKTKWENGYWKMNDSLLDKELYTEYINNFWINWKQRNKSNLKKQCLLKTSIIMRGMFLYLKILSLMNKSNLKKQCLL